MRPGLYCYTVYVRHSWGTDKIVVTTKKRSVKVAEADGLARAMRFRKDGSAEVLDVVPMKWTEHGLVETRKMRVRTGELKARRRAKARASVRQNKRRKAA